MPSEELSKSETADTIQRGGTDAGHVATIH
jgi:hypothetical protein